MKHHNVERIMGAIEKLEDESKNKMIDVGDAKFKCIFCGKENHINKIPFIKLVHPDPHERTIKCIFCGKKTAVVVENVNNNGFSLAITKMFEQDINKPKIFEIGEIKIDGNN